MSGGHDRSTGWRKREFLEIGGTHVRNVRLTSYHDELLAAAVGEPVAVSVEGFRSRAGTTKVVFGVYTPAMGVVRLHWFRLLFMVVGRYVVALICAPFAFAFLLLVSMLLGKVNEIAFI